MGIGGCRDPGGKRWDGDLGQSDVDVLTQAHLRYCTVVNARLFDS